MVRVASINGHTLEEGASEKVDALDSEEKMTQASEPILELVVPLFYQGSLAIAKEGQAITEKKLMAYELTFKTVVGANDYAAIVSKVRGHKVNARFIAPDGVGEP